MRSRFLLIACLLIMGVCIHCKSSKPVDVFVQNYDTGLSIREGVWLYKNKRFTGYRIESDRNGKLLYQLPIINGKEEGEAVGWYNTGEKLLVSHFLNGKKQGQFEQWWPNGHTRYLFHYSGGILDGQQCVFYPSGQKRQESNFSMGVEEGIQRVWNDKGELVSNYTIKGEKIYGIVSVKSCLPNEH